MASINILGVPQTQNTFSVLENKTVMIHDLSAPLASSTEQTNLKHLKSFNEAPIEVTYSEFYNLITNNQLSIGFRYAIIDFQTIYDQMDFDNTGALKGTLTTKTGAIEQIWVLALSSNQIADKAYSATYPNDEIQYDWTYSTTLVNGAPAKGRITERIDEWNNRTDYDHREIKFIRYDDGNGNYVIINDNGNAPKEFLTFGDNYANGGTINGNYLGDFFSVNFLIGQEFSNNVFNGGLVVENKTSALSYNNTWNKDAYINTIYGFNTYNIFYEECSYNNTNGYFAENIFYDKCNVNSNVGFLVYNIFIKSYEGNFNSGGTDGNVFNEKVDACHFKGYFESNNIDFLTNCTFLGRISGCNINVPLYICNFRGEFISNNITGQNPIQYADIVSKIELKNIDEVLFPDLYNTIFEKRLINAQDNNIYLRCFDGTNDINVLIP